VRAADAAVWRRLDLGAVTDRLQHVAPILVIEVAGTDEEESALREKADWYLGHGVRAVWLILPDTKDVVVVRSGSESRLGEGDRVPEMSELPGLCPEVVAFFVQLQGSQT
jgi:Uma2 family endonuclease